MITVRPYEDYAAHAVLTRLDHIDQMEAELTRGAKATGLELWADWRAMNPVRLGSWVMVTDGAQPFAVLGLSHTGQAGVAAAALLARDHSRFRRPLAQAAVTIRRRLPLFAAETGLRRIEARAWAAHPTACDLLQAIGFREECRMPGFGADGRAVFVQFAWTAIRPEQAASRPALEALTREVDPCAS